MGDIEAATESLRLISISLGKMNTEFAEFLKREDIRKKPSLTESDIRRQSDALKRERDALPSIFYCGFCFREVNGMDADHLITCEHARLCEDCAPCDQCNP